MTASASLSWDQVLAWRMRRQYLDPLGQPTALEVVRRLCGVQAQVASSAEFAVTVRRVMPGADTVASGLADRTLVKTWAMRGTLHVLPADTLGAYLAMVSAVRSWERPAWQKAYVTTAQLAALTKAAWKALDGKVLSREELIGEVLSHTSDPRLAEQLRSGWGTVLKPLAWQGFLVNGPAQGTRVTFTRPDTWLKGWRGLPDADEAARVVVPAYLSAYGPASMSTFDQWLSRGATKKSTVKAWYDACADLLSTVDVEGERLLVRAADTTELRATAQSRAVRLLGGFDQYLLGPGTGDPRVVAAQHRAKVSKAAGWIAPVVLHGGRVVGVWEPGDAGPRLSLFEDAKGLPRKALQAEVARIRSLTSPAR